MAEVSVIIPNYNHSLYLKERIDSILNQSFYDFEVIILDDKSQDASVEIIESYRNHPKVSHIVLNTVNSGSTFKQWNKGVTYASGNWIMLAESDDLAAPDLLEKLMVPAVTDNQVVLSYCQSNKIDAAGNITGNWKDWTDEFDTAFFDQNFIMDGEDYISNFLVFKNTIPNASAVLFKKQIFNEVGTTDEDVRYCSDWLLWLKILSRGKVAFCASSLNSFRFHNKSVIASTATTAGVPFKKKYDIFLRKKLNVFLPAKNKRIRVQNKILLEQEVRTEFSYLFRKKRFKLSAPFFVDMIILKIARVFNGFN